MPSAQFFHNNNWGYQYWGTGFWDSLETIPSDGYFASPYWGNDYWGSAYWGLTSSLTAPAGTGSAISVATVAGAGASLFDAAASAQGFAQAAAVTGLAVDGVASASAGSVATGSARSRVEAAGSASGLGVAAGVGLGPNNVAAAVGVGVAPAVGTTAGGRTVLTWTASTDPSVTRYYVGWDTVTHASGLIEDYPQRRDVGNVLTYTVTGLVVGRTYYFGVASAGAGGSVTTPDAFTSLPTEISRLPSDLFQGVGSAAGASNVVVAIGASLVSRVAAAAGTGAADGRSAYAIAALGESIGVATANAVGAEAAGTSGTVFSDGVGAAAAEGASLLDAVAESVGTSIADAGSGYIQDVDATAYSVADVFGDGAALSEAVAESAGTSAADAEGYALQPSFEAVATCDATSSASAEGAFNAWGVAFAEGVALVEGLSIGSMTAIGMAAARAEASAVGQNGTVTLSGGDLDTITERVWAHLIEHGFTAKQIQRLIAAVLAGRVHGAGTGVEYFRSLTDEKDRLTVVVDRSGNRTAIVTDVD